MGESHRPERFERLRKLPVVGRAADWGMGPRAVSKNTKGAGLALRLARSRGGPWVQHLTSVLFLLAGLAFRFAWVGAGRTSARDHEAVARMHREPRT